ncbi:MAG: hypothetical protein ABF289_06930 [Clostridiales bacterium]
MKKVLGICFLMCFLFNISATVFADDEAEFSAMYGAETGTDHWGPLDLLSADKYEDVRMFKEGFESLGGWTNLHTTYFGQKNDIKGSWEMSDGNWNETDILYWSGHGLSDGTLSYYDEYDYVNYDVSTFKGYDTVGDDIVSWNSTNGYKTNSSWNYDMEWAIFAACNQFTTANMCRAWARTLCGYPNRAHSVWGYSANVNSYSDEVDGLAPTGPVDTRIVQDFIKYARDGSSVKWSWIQANRDNYQRDWAGVSHFQNRYDRLWGCGTTYASTSVTSIPDIFLYDEDLSDPEYDNGYWVNPANVSFQNDNFNITNLTLENLFSLLNISNKNIKQKFNQTIEKNNKIFYVSANIIGEEIEEIEEIAVKRNVNYDETIEKVFGKSKNKISSSIEKNKDHNIKTYESGNKRLSVSEDGTLEINEHELVDENKDTFYTGEVALEYAENRLKEYNLFEEDSQIVLQSTINKQKLNINEEDNIKIDEEKYSIAYTISVSNKMNGLPVSVNNGNVIDIVIDSNGTSSIKKKWASNIIDKGKKKKIISKFDIIDVLKNNINKFENNLTITNIVLVYSEEKLNESSAFDCKFIPVWELWTDNDSIIKLNAYTGELIE